MLAACLAVFFSFASLAPLVAQSFNRVSSEMQCCRTKGKCCCHKGPGSAGHDGPAVAAAPCADCGGAAMGSTRPDDSAVVPLQAWVLAVRPHGAIAPSAVTAESRNLEHSLQQRPPPVNPLS